MVVQLASRSGIHGNVSRGRNGVVGTNDERSTKRSNPCNARAPAWLARARARSRVGWGMVRQATWGRPGGRGTGRLRSPGPDSDLTPGAERSEPHVRVVRGTP